MSPRYPIPVWAQPGHHARLDGDEGRLPAHRADDRLPGLLDAVHAEPERLADQVHRLREPDVTDDRAVGESGPEGLRAGSHTLAAHDRRAVRAEVVDAGCLDALDRVASGGERHDQQVQHQSGVDADAHDRDAVGDCQRIELVGDVRALGRDVGQLLGDRHDVDPGLQDAAEVAELVTGPGRRRDHHHVHRGGVQDRRGIAGDDHAELTAQSEHLAEVPADQVGPGVDRRHELQARLVQDQARHPRAHRPQPPLQDAHLPGAASSVRRRRTGHSHLLSPSPVPGHPSMQHRGCRSTSRRRHLRAGAWMGAARTAQVEDWQAVPGGVA